MTTLKEETGQSMQEILGLFNKYIDGEMSYEEARRRVFMNELYLSKEQMEKLTTKRLLAYKAKLMKTNEQPNEDGTGISKEHPLWKEAYKNIKEVLATREHVE